MQARHPDGEHIDTLVQVVVAGRAEAARLAVLRERSRIAREFHDVVAHHLSLIVIEAQAAPHRVADLPPQVGQAFAALRDLARDGLSEMRGLLRVLRDPGDVAERGPQPDLAAVASVVDGVRQAGVPVELCVRGAVESVPAGVQVAGFRIVQEALSNAARHGRGAPVRVEVQVAGGRLAIRVVNGRPPGGESGAGARASGPEPTGLGLIGMRERATALGGVFHAGAGEDGGFAVEAILPMDSSGSGGEVR